MSQATDAKPTRLFGDQASRVFIVGAGVSATSGIPVAKDLFSELMKANEHLSDNDTKEIHRLLTYLYPGFSRQLENYPNIEDFLNQIEMAKRFNTEDFVRSTLWPRKRLQAVLTAVIQGTAKFIRAAMRDKHSQRFVRKFSTDYIRPGDVIVSFNWDTLIEEAIQEHKSVKEVKYLYFGNARGMSDELYILKPHGSVDWTSRIRLTQSGIKRMSPRVLEYDPLMVPPVSDKGFEVPFLKRVWRCIYDAVSEADYLEILGYSLPPEDQFARFVLRRAIRNNFKDAERNRKRPLKAVVVNKRSEVKKTFEGLLGNSFTFYETTFENYVTSMLPTVAS